MTKAKVRDIMNAPPVTISPGDHLEEAARVMLDNEVGSLIVVDGEEVVGMMTDSDFGATESGIPFSTFRSPKLLGRWLGEESAEEIYQEARSRTVEEIMARPVHSVRQDAGIREVLDVMMKKEVKHVPVVDDAGRPVGMVTRHDLLRLVYDSQE